MFRRFGETPGQFALRNAMESAQAAQRWREAGYAWTQWQKKKNDLLFGSFARRQTWSSRYPQYTLQPGRSAAASQSELAFQATVERTARERQQPKPSATIHETRPEYNVQHNGEKGMYIFVTFSVGGLQGRIGTAAAHFYFANGAPLKDFNNSYRTRNGQVCTAQSFASLLTTVQYKDFALFMPYYELHMRPGDYDLKFHTAIWDDQSRELAWSDWYPFTYQCS